MRRSSPYSKIDKPSKKGSSDKDQSTPINWWSLLQVITLINFVVVGYFIWNRNSSSSIGGVDPAIAAQAGSTSTDMNVASTFASTLVHNIQNNVASLQSNVVDRYHQFSEASSSAAHVATAGAFVSSSAPGTPASQAPPNPIVEQQIMRPELPACLDPEWCNIEMPSKSYYSFSTGPDDAYRWRQAMLQAASGEQVLLRRVKATFPSHFDFIDGDITFRKQHLAMDFFVDEVRDLSPLLPPAPGTVQTYNVDGRRRLDMFMAGDPTKIVEPAFVAAPSTKGKNKGKSKNKGKGKGKVKDETSQEPQSQSQPQVMRGALAMPLTEEPEEEYATVTSASLVNGKLKYPWEVNKRRVIPDPYEFRLVNRAPIVSICGYTAYRRDSQTYFSGNRLGGAFIDRRTFFAHWKRVKDRIDTPFIAVCALNENWGFISTNFPNRTAGWGQCCNLPRDKEVREFLDHPMTLALFVGQHHNTSHPKVVTLPRGLPTTWGSTRVLVWDMIRENLKKIKKDKLLFAAASGWGPRPQILRCVSNKFEPTDFDGHVKNDKQPRLDRVSYYQKLSGARFGLGLPGLGYDTFRAWELMTMGTIVVLERAVGFDRSMYRLPALLLEDFDLLTPQLLRQAYVEALYRADEFEYQRLTQNFWYSAMLNVSAAKSTAALLDIFPMEAELPDFARPRVPFDCWKTNSCGKGTKRVPASSC